MEINWPTIVTIGSIIGTVLLVFKTLRADIIKLTDKLSAFEKSTEHRLTKLEMEVKNTNQRLSTIEGYLIPKKIYRIEEPSKEEPKEN
jgi:hypothetical protein